MFQQSMPASLFGTAAVEPTLGETSMHNQLMMRSLRDMMLGDGGWVDGGGGGGWVGEY